MKNGSAFGLRTPPFLVVYFVVQIGNMTAFIFSTNLRFLLQNFHYSLT